MKKTNIILADPQPVYRRGLKSLLTDIPYWNVVGEASRTRELVEQLQLHQPNLLIIDYSKAFFDAKELARCLDNLPSCKVILLSSRTKDWSTFKFLEFSVHSYLTKECTIQDLKQTIDLALRGERFYCNFIVELLLKEKPELVPAQGIVSKCLTDREIEIAKLVAQGKVNKVIASELHLSPHTIHTHRKNIMKKLGLHSAVELASYVNEAGLI